MASATPFSGKICCVFRWNVYLEIRTNLTLTVCHRLVVSMIMWCVDSLNFVSISILAQLKMHFVENDLN